MILTLILSMLSNQFSAAPNFQFKDLNEDQFLIINDSVMGGRSNSQMTIQPAGAIFSGDLSLENNGGFASVRMFWPFTEETSNAQSLIAMRVKGDGQKYQLRLRTNKGFDGAAYRATFTTIKDTEQTVYFSVDDFTATFRGRTLNNMPDLQLNDVKQMGIMLADKQTGRFAIELFEMALVDNTVENR